MRQFDPSKMMMPEKCGLSAEDLTICKEQNDNAYKNFYILWRNNIQNNIDHYDGSNSLMEIYGSWEGKRCIVVGAGPSAKYFKNIEAIEKAQKAGIKVIAADRIHTFLRRNRIIPDLTFSLDAQPVVSTFFSSVDKKDTLVIGLNQYPPMIDRLIEQAGKVYFYLQTNPQCQHIIDNWRKYDRKLFALQSLIMCGPMMVEMAYWMGCKEIITVGHDLGWHLESEIEDIYGKIQEVTRVWVKEEQRYFWTIQGFKDTLSQYMFFLSQFDDINMKDSSGGLLNIISDKIPQIKNLEEILN